MLKHYYLITWRNIKNNKLFSFINISGLAIGLACFALIMSWVKYQFSYDKYHSHAKVIYRVAVTGQIGSTPILQIGTPAPMAQALYDEFPEVKNVARLVNGEVQLKMDDQIWLEKAVAVDSTFLQMFDIPLLQGNPQKALNQPHTAVISERLAKKLFAGANPVNQTIEIVEFGQSLKITGVFSNLPENTHFEFDVVASLISMDGFYNSKAWWNNNFATYVQIHEGTSASELQAKMPAFIDKYLFPNEDYSSWSANGNQWEYHLEPLTELHLKSMLNGQFKPAGNAKYVYILSIAAIFILVIACINFINLTTARYSSRAKEVGVRKVNGAHRYSLIKQFLGESIFFSLFALVAGVILYKITFHFLVQILGNFSAIDFTQPRNLLLLIALALTIGVASGVYPAFYLSGFQPIKVLKDKFKIGGQSGFRNALVVFQFSLSIVLLIATFLAYQQLSFLQNEKLGFDKEHVLVIPNALSLGENIEAFMHKMRENHQVKSVSISNQLPGTGFNNIGFGADSLEGFTLNLMAGNEDFAETIGLKMVEGRYFDKAYATDSNAIVINQAAAKLLGWQNPVGRAIFDFGQTKRNFNIVGVVEDFHYESKKQVVRPMALMPLPGVYHYSPNYVNMKVAPEGIQAVLEEANKQWLSLSNGLAFDYTFLDKEYDELYKNEAQSKKLFVLFSLLSVFIACLGLFGLVTYIAEKKTKEIGIRKAIGATSFDISLLLSLSFVKWIAMAFVLATPVAYFVMQQWLQNFAYQINVEWWVFVWVAIFIFMVALLTISYQTIRAALANPVESLRYE